MWEIKRSTLLAGLNLLELVPEKVGLSSSEFIWIRGHKDKITISVASYIMGEINLTGHGRWPVKGDFFIDRRALMPFVLAAKELKNKNTFRFTAHKTELTIRHGSRKVKLVSQKDVKGYGDLRKVMKHKETPLPISDETRELLLCGQNCAVSDAIVPHLNCVYISKSSVIETFASSNKVFYMGKGKIQKGIKSSIPFPLFLIKLLGEESLKDVSWRGNFVVFNFDKGLIWQPISVDAMKNFPLKHIKKYEKQSRTLPMLFTVSSRRMSKLMVRLGYYLQKVNRRDWLVSLQGDKGSDILKVSTEIPGVKFQEYLTIQTKLKKDVKLDWPLDVLIEMFSFLATKTKKMGIIIRHDPKHGTFLRVGMYWLLITTKQEEQ